MDLVRRDWCSLSKETGKYVLDQILSGQPKEEIVFAIHTYLTELAANIRADKFEVGRFAITKGNSE